MFQTDPLKKMLQEIANVYKQTPVSKLIKFSLKNKTIYKIGTGAVSVFVQPNIWAMASAQWYFKI
jgi:hypothetical protein